MKIFQYCTFVLFLVFQVEAESSSELSNPGYDPFFWINLRYSCNEIEENFNERFEVSEDELSVLSNIQQQELKYVREETCIEHFAKCKFFWCKSKTVETRLKVESDTVVTNAVASDQHLEAVDKTIANGDTDNILAEKAREKLKNLIKERKVIRDKLFEESSKKTQVGNLPWQKVIVPVHQDASNLLSQPSAVANGTRIFSPSVTRPTSNISTLKVLPPKSDQAGALRKLGLENGVQNKKRNP